jgi:thioredoxin-related protein
MKLKAIVLALFSLFCFSAFAQESVNMAKDTTTPPYLKYPDMPAFKIRLADSVTVINTFNIKKGRPTLLILFGADCEHCKQFTDSLVKHIDSFKDANIYMFTFSPFPDLRKFIEEHKLKEYKNITMGNDAELFFPGFYKVSSVPGIAVYDKNKKIVKLFTGTVKVEDIAAAAKPQ